MKRKKWVSLKRKQKPYFLEKNDYETLSVSFLLYLLYIFWSWLYDVNTVRAHLNCPQFSPFSGLRPFLFAHALSTLSSHPHPHPHPKVMDHPLALVCWTLDPVVWGRALQTVPFRQLPSHDGRLSVYVLILVIFFFFRPSISNAPSPSPKKEKRMY